MHQMKWEPIDRVAKSHTETSTRSIRQLVHSTGARQSLRCILEVLAGFHDKSRAAEFIDIAFSRAVHERLGAGSAVINCFSVRIDGFDLLEAKVIQELGRFGDVFVGIVDVGQADEADLTMVSC